MITITNVEIKLTHNKGMKALCSVTISDMFVVHGIRLIQLPNGRNIVAMPSKKEADGTFKEVCHPTSATARKIIETAVLEKYEQITSIEEDIVKMLQAL